MTIDIKKLLSFYINKQAAISHATDKTFLICTKDEIPQDMMRQIKEKYGDATLNGSNCILFIKKNEGLSFDKKDFEKITRLMDSAFGKSANNSSEGDIKKLMSNLVFAECTLQYENLKSDGSEVADLAGDDDIEQKDVDVPDDEVSDDDDDEEELDESLGANKKSRKILNESNSSNILIDKYLNNVNAELIYNNTDKYGTTQYYAVPLEYKSKVADAINELLQNQKNVSWNKIKSDGENRECYTRFYINRVKDVKKYDKNPRAKFIKTSNRDINYEYSSMTPAYLYTPSSKYDDDSSKRSTEEMRRRFNKYTTAISNWQPQDQENSYIVVATFTTPESEQAGVLSDIQIGLATRMYDVDEETNSIAIDSMRKQISPQLEARIETLGFNNVKVHIEDDQLMVKFNDEQTLKKQIESKLGQIQSIIKTILAKGTNTDAGRITFKLSDQKPILKSTVDGQYNDVGEGPHYASTHVYHYDGPEFNYIKFKFEIQK